VKKVIFQKDANSKKNTNEQVKLAVNFMVTNSCYLFSSYKLNKSEAIYIP